MTAEGDCAPQPGATPDEAATVDPPPETRAPKFIVVTGCNGVGKSTVARALERRLGARIFHYPPEFVRFREAVSLDTEVSAVPRLLYYLAATLQLSDLVRQQLTHSHVICDRYLESPVSLLVVESAFAESDVERICEPFRRQLRAPDLTLFLTTRYESACARILKRSSTTSTRVQRRVLESPDFFLARETAIRMQAMKLGPMRELDTTGLGEEQMCRCAWDLVAEIFGKSR